MMNPRHATLLVSLLACFACGDAHATSSPNVRMLGCGVGVHVASGGVRLSDLLRHMSQVMRFDLNYWADDDPVVALEVQKHPQDIMRALSSRANMIVVYRDKGRCSGQADVKAVWVLPGGTSSPLPPAQRVPQGVRASNAPTSPRGGPAVDLDDSTREYMELHGLLPDSDAKPAPR